MWEELRAQSTHYLSYSLIVLKNDLVKNTKKMRKQYFQDYTQSTATSSDHDKICNRMCAHQVPTIRGRNHALQRNVEYYVSSLFENAGWREGGGGGIRQ